MQYACPFFIPLSQRVSVGWGVSNEQMIFFEYLKTLVHCSSRNQSCCTLYPDGRIGMFVPIRFILQEIVVLLMLKTYI